MNPRVNPVEMVSEEGTDVMDRQVIHFLNRGRLGMRLLTLGLALTAAAQAWAQGGGCEWEEVKLLPGLSGHAMAYDSDRRVIVVFGGTTGSGPQSDETWEYDIVGQRWTLKASGMPSGRFYAAMAYDQVRKETILFGGSLSNETWAWNGTAWTLKSTSGPTGRDRHAMTFHGNSTSGLILLFGGWDGAYDDETWEWNGSVWTKKLPVAKPSARYLHCMVYDSVRNRTVLFGGVASGVDSSQTWEWTGTNWEQKLPATKPSARSSHMMTFASFNNKVILFGGYSSASGQLNDTWEWSGTAWTQPVILASPPPLSQGSLIYDPASSGIYEFGGEPGPSRKLWARYGGDSSNWKIVPALGSGPDSLANTAMTYDAGRKHTIIFGGYSADVPPFNTSHETWIWSNGDWQLGTDNGGLGARVDHAVAYDAARQEVVLFGGNVYGGNDNINDTLVHDGSSWKKLGPVGCTPRTGHAMAYHGDEVDGYVLLWGGQKEIGPLSNETWTWNGTAWTYLTDVGPSPRKYHMMAYDTNRDRTVLFGGYLSDATLSSETWEWDGSQWNYITSAGPSPRQLAGMTYDSARKLVLLSGGSGDSAADTWSWNGTDWTLEESGFASSTAVMAYDAAAQATMLLETGFVYGSGTWLYGGALPTPDSTIEPSSVCYDDSETVALSVADDIGADLHWFEGSCDSIDLGFGNPLIIDSPSTTTTYYARWESDCATSACNSITLEVIQAPLSPDEVSVSDAILCSSGSPDTIRLEASGGEGDALNWYVDRCGETLIGTGNSLIVDRPTVDTTYYAAWENDCGESECGSITVDVLDPLDPPVEPTAEPAVVCPGDEVTLSADTPTGVTTDWFTDGCGEAPAGKGPTPTVYPTVTTSYYAMARELSTGCVSSECSVVSVTASNEPLILQQPADQDLCPGQAISFTVEVDGVPPFSYQWRKDGVNLSDGDNISGARTAALTLEPVEADQVGLYDVAITDDCGMTISDAAQLTLRIPVITEPPVSQLLCPGKPLSLSVTAGGTPPLTYQWRKDGQDLVDGGNVDGSATSSLTLDPAFADDIGAYDVLVSDACGSATSAPATLTLLEPVIIAQPMAQSFCPGESVVLTVEAAGTPPFTYEWHKDGILLRDGGHVSGSTTSTLTLDPSEATDAGEYAVQVEDDCGTVMSDPASLSVELPLIIQHPEDQVVCGVSPVTFTVAASGTPPLEYQWRQGGVELADNDRQTGTQTDTLSLIAPEAADVGSYDVVITDLCGTVTSAVAVLSDGRPIIDGYAVGSSRTGLTTGAETITLTGKNLLTGMAVTFKTPTHVSLADPEGVQANAEGTELSVRVPAFAPGCDCADVVAFPVDVEFETSCGFTSLFQEGVELFQYDVESLIVSSPTGVQEAIDEAASGTCIVLVPDVNYVGPLFVEASKSRLTLTGADLDPGKTQIDGEGFPGGPPPTDPTVTFDGHGPGVCMSRVNAILGNSAVMVLNGAAPIITGCTFDDNAGDTAHGGGITISSDSNPIVFNNTIAINSTLGSGGGLRIENASAVVFANSVYSNSASTFGGALYLKSTPSTLVVSDNAIWLNTYESTVSKGGGVYWDGASSLDRAEGLLIRNDIWGNAATDDGAGVYLGVNVSPTITGNTIRENSGLTASALGGGIYVESNNRNAVDICANVFFGNEAQVAGAIALLNKTEVNVNGNIIFCNRAVQLDPLGNASVYAGGIYVLDAGAQVLHNTIFGNWGSNTSNQSGGIHLKALATGSPLFKDNILMNNEDWEVYTDTPLVATTKVDFNLLYDRVDPDDIFSPLVLSPGENNIWGNGTSDDPLFSEEPLDCTYTGGYDEAYASFAVLAGSPAMGSASDGSNMGIVMSAAEPQSCVERTPTDCNGNGIPDTTDFVLGILHDGDWNAIPDECNGDLNLDGVVDLYDYSVFSACIRGAGRPYPVGCEWADGDLDGDVDLVDFGAFQRAVSQ